MLNWIVIGIGDITIRRVIPAIQAEPRSRLYGFVTRDPAKAKPYDARVFATLDAALADPEVHAVYVGTPVFLHAPQTIQSLRAGKHVLCEKPMAMNEAEARLMVEAAEESGKTFGVAYYRRCYPKVQRAKAAARSGRDRQTCVRRTDQSHVISTAAATAAGCSIPPKPVAGRCSISRRIASTFSTFCLGSHSE